MQTTVRTPTTTLLDTKPATLDDVIDYLQFDLDTFEYDPADTDFQRGYEQALRDVQTELLCWHLATDCGPNGTSEFLGGPLVRRVH